ncbi:MAG: penicillin-binding protein, partial [Chitinophagaceae bacterium]
ALPDPDVKDTAAAFVYKQSPAHKDAEGRTYRIRPGQMIDIWLSAQKPAVDSTVKPKTETLPQAQDPKRNDY